METPSNKRSLVYAIIGIIVFVLLVVGLEKLAKDDSRFQSAVGNTQDTSSDTKVKGNAEAPVTLLVYSDFQCPACAAYEPLLKQLEQEFPDTLRTVYRYFPLPMHKNAVPSARAAEAARLQGKFWEMHDKLFEHQNDWAESTNPNDTFHTYAEEIGLDTARFDTDIQSDSVADAVKQDQAKGNKDAIRGTPTFFFNGKQIQNPQSYEALKQSFQQALDTASKK